MIVLNGHRDTLPADPARGRAIAGKDGCVVVEVGQQGAWQATVHIERTNPPGYAGFYVSVRRGPFPWLAKIMRGRWVSGHDWRRAWMLFVERCRREGVQIDYRRPR